MYKYDSKIKYILVVLFATVLVLYGASDVSTRTDNIKNNSVSSSIPYSFHYEKFQNSIIKTFDKLNLSPYGGMSLFVGYGLADKKEQNCYFIDHSANVNILTDFTPPQIIGSKSYLMSRSKLSYSQCKGLTVKHAGYVYNPETITRDSEIDRRFADKDFWIGLSKADCGSDWVNQYGITQQFNRLQGKSCDSNKLNISSRINSLQWLNSQASESHYCLLQIDSKDYLRPIKVCAPWWQIEQSYSLDCDKRTSNLLPFYNMSVPKKLSVCVENDTNTTGATNDIDGYEALYNNKSNWKKYTCTSYYSKKAGASCLEDMLQDQCYINECAGSIERKCQLLGTFSSEIKNYEIGTVVNNAGVLSKGKIKDRIKTFEYSCPPTRPSIAGCLEYEEINLLPTDECQPGGCDTYFNCLNENPNNLSACDSEKTGCERRYGYDIMVSNGKAEYALVKCNDGSVIRNYNINSISTVKSRCVEFEIENSFANKAESCEAELIKIRHSVDAGLLESDIYSLDESCVRLNNEGNIPSNSYYLEFNTTNYFKTKIGKVTTVISEADLNTTSNATVVVDTLGDGNYTVSMHDGNSSTSVETLAELRDVFAQVDALIVGDDSFSQFFLNGVMQTFTSKEAETNATTLKEVEYDYFSREWWNKRVYLFNDPSVNSITRPYSKFAQCAQIPLDNSKSSYGTPSPQYIDGNPVVGGEVIHEGFESDAYISASNDTDVASNGQYCRRGDNSQNVNWYGDSASELYYNDYNCSRLFGANGEVWATPVNTPFVYAHKALELNSTVVLTEVLVSDTTSTYGTKSECQSSTGKICKAVGVPIVVTFEALYLSTTSASTDKYKAVNPSRGSSFDWVTGANSASLSSDFLNNMGIDYLSISNDTNFKSWLNNAFSNYSSAGILHEKNDAQITIESDTYIPENYELVGGVAVRKENITYYTYTCPVDYTAIDAGVLNYNTTDTDLSSVNDELFVSPNSAQAPENNCKLNNYDSVLVDISDYFTTIKTNNNGDYCKIISDVNTSVVSSTADYNCSKYFNSMGEWDYQEKTYYLYNATNYKRFRSDTCGYGDFNINGINKDGSNAMMIDSTSVDFISDIARASTYTEFSMDFKDDFSASYKIPNEKLLAASLDVEANYKIIDKNLDPIDDVFELFRVNGKIRLLSVHNMSDVECVRYMGDLKKINYEIDYAIENSKCLIDVDYFGGALFKEEPITEVAVDIKEGSFDFNLTGYNSILTVESYLDGEFGYKSNHASKLYEDSVVKINGREIYPIVSIGSDLTTDANLNYKRNIGVKLTATRSTIVKTAAEIEMEAITATREYQDGLIGGAAPILGDIALISTEILHFSVLSYVVNLFGDVKDFADITRNITLYMDKTDYRTFPNVYGNDPRTETDISFVYYKTNYVSGTRERKYAEGEQSAFASSIRSTMTENYGLEAIRYDGVQKPADSGITFDNPEIAWWENGSKTDRKNFAYNDKIVKPYNVVYYGATNSITLFLPYESDYEVFALDKSGNILGRKNIYSDEFITSSTTQPYKQIFFSTDPNFDLANGVAEGSTTGACRNSTVAEWGGGVSGAYYSFGTNENYTCDKSNDEYVKEHSAVFLAVRIMYSKNFNIVKLKKPLPFANRVFVTTLRLMQTREYTCYADNNCSLEQ